VTQKKVRNARTCNLEPHSLEHHTTLNEIVPHFHLIVLLLIDLPQQAPLAPILNPLHQCPPAAAVTIPPSVNPPLPQATAAHPLRHVAPQGQDIVYVNCFNVHEFLELIKLLGTQTMDVH
jgi:hypothetical protein